MNGAQVDQETDKRDPQLAQEMHGWIHGWIVDDSCTVPQGFMDSWMVKLEECLLKFKTLKLKTRKFQPQNGVSA